MSLYPSSALRENSYAAPGPLGAGMVDGYAPASSGHISSGPLATIDEYAVLFGFRPNLEHPGQDIVLPRHSADLDDLLHLTEVRSRGWEGVLDAV